MGLEPGWMVKTGMGHTQAKPDVNHRNITFSNYQTQNFYQKVTSDNDSHECCFQKSDDEEQGSE